MKHLCTLRSWGYASVLCTGPSTRMNHDEDNRDLPLPHRELVAMLSTVVFFIVVADDEPEAPVCTGHGHLRGGGGGCRELGSVQGTFHGSPRNFWNGCREDCWKQCKRHSTGTKSALNASSENRGRERVQHAPFGSVAAAVAMRRKLLCVLRREFSHSFPPRTENTQHVMDRGNMRSQTEIHMII